jgi:uncharacterized membrane protein YhaH (DUF805 family)
MVSSSSQPPALFEHFASAAATTDAAVGRNALQSEADGGLRSTAFSRARQRLLQFQSQQLSKCRVFVIPCVAVSGAGDADFALARPAFDLRLLRPLQRVADAHPKFYWSSMILFLGLPSFVLVMFIDSNIRGIPNVFFNSALVVFMLGFVSSRHYNVDRVAVRHVVLSFRYLTFVVLLLQWIALYARRAHLVLSQGSASIYDKTPWAVAAVVMLVLCFCLCLLFDCSPQLPAAIQTFTTVRACNVARH